MINCYYEENGTRCQNPVDKQLAWWCSEEHKEKWQKANIFDKKPEKRRLTILEIQKRLLEMGKEARKLKEYEKKY